MRIAPTETAPILSKIIGSVVEEYISFNGLEDEKFWLENKVNFISRIEYSEVSNVAKVNISMVKMLLFIDMVDSIIMSLL